MNIWRIWVPKKQKVINARDCIFDESSLYEPSDYLQLINDQSEEPIQPLTIEEFNQVIQDIEIDLDIENIDIDYHIQPQPIQPDNPDIPTNDIETAELENRSSPNDVHYFNSNETNDQVLGDIPITPIPTPPMVLIDSQSIAKEDYHNETNENEPENQPPTVLINNQFFEKDDYPSDNQESEPIDDDIIMEDAISSYKRYRTPSPDAPSKRLHSFLCAFSAGLLKEPKRIYRDELLPEPKSWKEVLNHLYKD